MYPIAVSGDRLILPGAFWACEPLAGHWLWPFQENPMKFMNFRTATNFDQMSSTEICLGLSHYRKTFGNSRLEWITP